MHFVHLMNPYRQNILSIVLPFVGVPFSLSSICKYWISVNEDTSSLKLIEQMCWCVLSEKQGVSKVLPLIHNQHLKNSAHCSWDIYQEKVAGKFNKVSWWALWVGDPRNFQSNFFVKNYYFQLNSFFKYCSMFFLKTKKQAT